MNTSMDFSKGPDGKTNQRVPTKPATLIISTKPGASELRTVKCCRCYHYDVVAVCHHCGRFVCRRCLRVSGGWFFADRVFAGLKPSLGRKLKRAAHCPDCYHHDWQMGAILGVISLGLAIFLLIAWGNVGLVQRLGTLGGSIVLVLAGWLADRWRGKPTYPLGLPLFTKLKVEIEECVQADININDHPYLMPEPVGQGFIQTTVDLTPNDLERVEQMAAVTSPITFYAGFVGLETLKNIKFVHHSGLRYRPNLLLLTKTMDYEEFARLCRTSTHTTLIERYQIQANALQVGPPHNREFPLIIKPRRANGGYRLEIIFDIPVDLKLKFTKNDLKKERIEKGLEGRPILDSLTLHIPIGCEVETSDGHYDQEKRILHWYKNDLEVKPTFSAFVQFREIISNKMIFRGSYSITIKSWTISQLHVAPDVMVPNRDMVRPANGLRLAPSQEEDKDLAWLMPTVEHRTKIQGSLSINAAHLLSQQVQTMPAVTVTESIKEVIGQETHFQSNHQNGCPAESIKEMTSQETLPVAPNDYVINAIVEALSTEHVFVKQMTENPGYVTDTEMGSVRARFWRIWAKYYLEDTLRPVDVRLIISGQGPQGNHLNSEGSLTFELSLRSYIELDDQHIDGQLQNLYEKCRNIIKIAAHRGRQINYQGRRVFAWKLEQKMERELERFQYAKNAAVILTGGNQPVQGYVFLPLACRNGHLPQLPKSLQLRPCQRLPQIEAPGIVWVDKWALLKQIEAEE